MTDQDILNYLAKGAAELRNICNLACSMSVHANEYGTRKAYFKAYCENSLERFSPDCATMADAIAFHREQFRESTREEKLREAIAYNEAQIELLRLELVNLQPE